MNRRRKAQTAQPKPTVYLVTNRVSGKQYIGQTRQGVARRWRQHEADALKRRRVGALQCAIRSYGVENFLVEPIEFCESQRELDLAEAHWIRWYGTLSPGGYNLSQGGDSAPRTPETCRKISDAKRGKPLSARALAACAAAGERRRGVKLSPEHRANIGAGQIGNRRSPETGRKIAASKRGVPLTPEHKAKVGASGKGKRRSPETIERMRVAARKRWDAPGRREKQSALWSGAANPGWKGGAKERHVEQSESSDVLSASSRLLALVLE